jgi:hypothetical protein
MMYVSNQSWWKVFLTYAIGRELGIGLKHCRSTNLSIERLVVDHAEPCQSETFGYREAYIVSLLGPSGLCKENCVVSPVWLRRYRYVRTVEISHLVCRSGEKCSPKLGCIEGNSFDK